MVKETQEYRVMVEHRLTNLEGSVNEIKTNHLPHIEEKVDRLTWLIVTSLLGILSTLAISFFH